MQQAEEQRLQPKPEPRLEEPSEQQLLTETAEHGHAHDASARQTSSEWAERVGQLLCPGKALDQTPRHDDNQRAERETNGEAVGMADEARQVQPWIRIGPRGV